MNDNKSDGFKYTYSAKEQAEVRRIREKYENKEDDKMTRLRRLDAAVTQKAQAIALIFGVIGALVLGLGLSFIMSDLGAALGRGALPIGILIGAVGGVLVGLAYPMYSLVTNRERQRIAPEIIRLTDELIK